MNYNKYSLDRKNNTSWQKVSRWYNESLGQTGDYFHRKIVIPKILLMMNLKPGDSVLDLGCGQGILARHLPKSIDYCGVDLSTGLLSFAKNHDINDKHQYIKADIAKPLNLDQGEFSHAVVVLALQNVNQPQMVISNASKYLKAAGQLAIVINHPCFRIPRQSSWQIDERSKLQYRRVNRYLSPLKIPINMQPSRGSKGNLTWSFHFPLSQLCGWLYKNAFLIEKIEEWVSDKVSVGEARRMENLARSEFPMFLAVLAKKHSV